jgi:two-component system response regulator PrrA
MARVLLIEDDEAVAEGLETLLRFEGFEVDLVATGRLAIELTAHTHPDIVVLDLTLPDIDGITVARAVRDAWPALPVVISTGHYPGLPKLLVLAKVALLQKPYEFKELLVAITTLLSP